MKSSSSILVVVLLVGLFVVPFNCQDATNVVVKPAAEANEKTIGDNNPVNITTTPAPTNPTKPSDQTTDATTDKSTTNTTTSEKPETTTTPVTTTIPQPNTTTTTTTTSSSTTTTEAPETTTTTTTTTTSTVAPETSTSAPNTTTTSTTPAPSPTPLPPCRRFDGPSFIGGIVLTLGLLAIGLVAYKFYKARNERNYQTL